MANAALHAVPNYTICDIIMLNIDIILELLYPEEVEEDVAKLKRLREDRVLSQRELARMAGLTHVTVWRQGNRLPRILHCQRQAILRFGKDQDRDRAEVETVHDGC